MWNSKILKCLWHVFQKNDASGRDLGLCYRVRYTKKGDYVSFWGKPLLFTLFVFWGSLSFAEVDWSEAYTNPVNGRPNPYELSNEELQVYKTRGQIHAQRYPVSVTGVLLPEEPIQRVLNDDSRNPIKLLFNQIFRNVIGVENFNDLFRWAGLIDRKSVV